MDERRMSLRDAFGQTITDLAAEREDFVLFDADVRGGTGTRVFLERWPDRFFQFGTAEQGMMAAAGGFASSGIIPIVSTFSVFGVCRAHEQLRIQICYPNRKVLIACSHLGLDVGPDGATAQALEDLATTRAIPNLAVVVPADPVEMRLAVPAVLDWPGPVYMRTGRSPAPFVFDDTHSFEVGKATVVRDGKDVTIVACGVMVARALTAAGLLKEDGISARVVNMSTIKPIDAEVLVRCAKESGCFVTAEDHSILGGLGSAVAEALAQSHPCPIEFVGVRDTFGESGEPEELAEKYGLTGTNIAAAARRVIERKGKR
jgi:transketolase